MERRRRLDKPSKPRIGRKRQRMFQEVLSQSRRNHGGPAGCSGCLHHHNRAKSLLGQGEYMKGLRGWWKHLAGERNANPFLAVSTSRS